MATVLPTFAEASSRSLVVSLQFATEVGCCRPRVDDTQWMFGFYEIGLHRQLAPHEGGLARFLPTTLCPCKIDAGNLSDQRVNNFAERYEGSVLRSRS